MNTRIVNTEREVVERSPYVGVIGAGECSRAIYQLAEKVGYQIGKRGWVLVCGGMGGVMEAAAKGCSEANGMTVGLLPGLDKGAANAFIRVALPTGLGEGRNLLVVRASDVLVSIAGEYGTLSEIALALKTNKPVIGLKTWPNLLGVRYASDFREAVRMLSEILCD